jgi:hypothetical protein
MNSMYEGSEVPCDDHGDIEFVLYSSSVLGFG